MSIGKTPVPKVVLTGGPGSGKSKGLAMLVRKLGEMGYTVMLVPEVASDLFGRGVKLSEVLKDQRTWAEFQRIILKAQFASEKISRQLIDIHSGDRKVIICDRGAMDGMAYVDPDLFKAIAAKAGISSISQIRDRYQGVVHLVTAAIGAEGFYNLNNPSRHETIEEAALLDGRTLAAWTGHEHLFIVGNRDNGTKILFRKKMTNLLGAVCKIIGIPVPIEIEKKYLLSLDATPPPGSVAFDITQTYLKRLNPDIERRVRRRVPVDHSSTEGTTYFYTEKELIDKNTREERYEDEKMISEETYLNLLGEKDLALEDVIKRRFCFPWENQYFQLDILSEPLPVVLLEIELTDKRRIPSLPPLLPIIREVTEDKRFSNHGIASGICSGYK